MLTSCGGTDPEVPVVVVIQDGTSPDARQVVTPGVLGLELGLEGSGLGTRIVDAADLDAGAEAADPQVVAVVIAPFTDPPDGLLAALQDAGVGVVSMSELAAAPTRGAPLRAVVPPLDVQVSAAKAVATCAAGDGSAWSDLLLAELGPITRLPGVPSTAAAEAAELGCADVVWTGAASGGTELAGFLGRTTPRARLIVGDRARTPAFAEAAPRPPSAFGLCPCADVTTSADPAAQRFVHGYQAANGLDPGPFAVEGYDAGRILATAAADGPSRSAVAEAIDGIERFEGLAGTYLWGTNGDLRDPVVRMYERVGVRWLERPPGRVAQETTRA